MDSIALAPSVSRGLPMRCALLALLLLAGSTAADDGRSVRSNGGPDWLYAIGKLTVPSQRLEDGRRRHHEENCSAILVQSSTGRALRHLLTAWHCIEHYGDLAFPIQIALEHPDGEVHRLTARLIESGGSMAADWAILRLSKPLNDSNAKALTVSFASAEPGDSVILAGFSRDAGLGRGGTVMTYDPNCRITEHHVENVESDCRAFKGASGGAVVRLDGEEAYLIGVVSSGDSDGRSFHVPLSDLATVLRNHL